MRCSLVFTFLRYLLKSSADTAASRLDPRGPPQLLIRRLLSVLKEKHATVSRKETCHTEMKERQTEREREKQTRRKKDRDRETERDRERSGGQLCPGALTSPQTPRERERQKETRTSRTSAAHRGTTAALHAGGGTANSASHGKCFAAPLLIVCTTHIVALCFKATVLCSIFTFLSEISVPCAVLSLATML